MFRRTTLLLAVMICTMAVPAMAAPPKTVVTGTETVVDVLDPGLMIPLGDKVYLLGMVHEDSVVTNDPRATGTLTIVVYGIVSTSDGIGSMWGTGSLQNANGSWSGSWTGERKLDGTDMITFAQGTFVGSGGNTGLTLAFSGGTVNEDQQSPVCYDITGYITKEKLVQRPMVWQKDIGTVRVNMDPGQWEWPLWPDLSVAVIPWTVEESGVATHWGKFEASWTGGMLAYLNWAEDGSLGIEFGPECGTGEVTTANGDKIAFFFEYLDYSKPGATLTVLGGTGRFKGATGVLTWIGHYTGPMDSDGNLYYDGEATGWIAY